jgi:hypothetical protein
MALVLHETVPPCTGCLPWSNEQVFVNHKEHVFRIMYNLYVLCSSSTISGMDVTPSVIEVANELFQYSYLSAAWDEGVFMTSYLRQAIIDTDKDIHWTAYGPRTVSDYKQYISISRGTIELMKFVQDVIGRGIALSSLQWFLSQNTKEAVKLTPECSTCIHACNIIDDTAYITKVWMCDTCIDRTQMLRLTNETREHSQSPGIEGDIEFAFDNFLSCAKTELVYAWTDEQSLLVERMFTYYMRYELSVSENGMTPVDSDIGMLDTAEPTISFMVLFKSQSDSLSSILFMYAMNKWYQSFMSKCEFGRTYAAKEPPVESAVVGLIIVAVSCDLDANRWRSRAISMGMDPQCVIIPSDINKLTSLLETATRDDVRMVDPIFIILRYNQITRSIAVSFSHYTFFGIVISESDPEVGGLKSMHYRNLLSLLSLNPLRVRRCPSSSYYASSTMLSGYTGALKYDYQRRTLRSPLSLPPVPTMYHTVNITQPTRGE